MEFLQTMLLRITVSAVLGGAAISMTQDSAMKQIIRLAVGMMIALSVLSPLANSTFLSPIAVFAQVSGNLQSEIVAQTEIVKQYNQDVEKSSVTGVMIQYIVDRADEMGVNLAVSLSMATDDQGLLIVKSAQITAKGAEQAQITAVQQMIAQECGIAEEKQQWTLQ